MLLKFLKQNYIYPIFFLFISTVIILFIYDFTFWSLFAALIGSINLFFHFIIVKKEFERFKEKELK